MNAFGSGPEEPMLTDQIDDEYDTLNEETFGGEIPNDEWESEQLSEEREATDSLTLGDRSILDLAASRLPISEDPLDFLEESISHLVEDDDDDIVITRKRSAGNSKPLSDIFAPGSPQTPFFQLDKSNIWSDSSLMVKKTAPTSSSVSGLLESLRINGGEPFRMSSAQGPVVVKGTKSVEELEAELLGKSSQLAGTIPSHPKVVGPAMKTVEELEAELLGKSKVVGPAAVKSCQELEHELKSGHPFASDIAKTVAGSAPASAPPTIPSIPQGPNMLAHLPPHHPMFANPQVRAALMARWLAANPGAVPPVWLRMHPPPMMPPPPAAAFRPTIIRPGINMPPMNFNNVRLPHGFAPRGIGLTVQQGGARRTSPSFPKRRLFDSPGRLRDDKYEGNRGFNRGDPFAGLMTRRERSWLIKIQSLQLHSENPYVDDYYWMMYRRRKVVGDGKTLMRNDHNDNFEHRVYVPPSFEGSLGKVQVLSANFPRQLLDLTASSANGDGNKQPNAEEDSPRDSPPVKAAQTVGGRRLKNVLIEIENLYTMLLEASDLTIIPEQEPSNTNGESKEKAAARARNLIKFIVSTLAAEDRIVNALSIRKGRRLLSQLVVFCDKNDCLTLVQAVARNLLPLSKKEPCQEIYSVIKLISDSKNSGMVGVDWSNLWDIVSLEVVENAMKNKLGFLLLLEMIQRSASTNATLSEGGVKAVERWASIMYGYITGSGKESQRASSLEKCQTESMALWMESLAGASIPSSVIEAIAYFFTDECKS